MPYPQSPEIATSYTAVEQALGNGSLPGQELDVDLAAIRASVTAVIEFLKTSLRSDGRLNNGSVSSDTLASSLIIGFDAPAPWMTATAYTTTSTVFQGYGFYLCVTAHTSGTFATDLASGRWVLLADLTPPGGALVAANNLSDVADVGNARANLGLGSMATVNAGTGAADFRTNLQNDGRFQQIAATLTSWIAITRASGFDAFVANPTSANLRALLTDETGTGALAFSGGAIDLTNATGLPFAGLAAAAVTTAAETIAANNVDTQVPTSAAVKAYVDANAGAAYYLAITADQTWNKPAGFSADQIVTFEAWGAGGGGARADGGNDAGGGGGGAYVRKEVRYADVASSIVITIGVGGGGRVGSQGNGSAGTSTVITGVVTARAGGGGGASTSGNSGGGGGGGEVQGGGTANGGGAGGAVGGGDGSVPANSNAKSIWGGGGGNGGAVTGGNAVYGGAGGGGSTSTTGGGAGVSLLGGAGGNGGTGGTNTAGTAPGGGGGGGGNTTNGKDGARGEVRIRIG